MEYAVIAGIFQELSLRNSVFINQVWARARPGATSLEHRVVVAVFRKQGPYTHALQARSGPGSNGMSMGYRLYSL